MDYTNYCEKTIPAEDIDIFRENSRIICAGSSNVGKTKIIIDLILFYESKFNKIYVCGSSMNHEILSHKILKKKLLF